MEGQRLGFPSARNGVSEHFDLFETGGLACGPTNHSRDARATLPLDLPDAVVTHFIGGDFR